mgnify:CR=1 FL=1
METDRVRESLKKMRTLGLEERDRRGYQNSPAPADAGEAAAWESEAAWPQGPRLCKDTQDLSL